MNANDFQDLQNTIDAQESMLKFEHFTNEDALQLGILAVNEAKAKGINMAISIRKPNNAIVFQHLMKTTNGANQRWMQRKFNTVIESEHSSLRMSCREAITNQTIEEFGHNLADFTYCGGGFPIVLKNDEVVGVFICSGLFHMKDHEFAVNVISKFLGVEGVPAISFYDRL